MIAILPSIHFLSYLTVCIIYHHEFFFNIYAIYFIIYIILSRLHVFIHLLLIYYQVFTVVIGYIMQCLA
jgi:hypothetical protein